jgi:hypothetical protein
MQRLARRLATFANLNLCVVNVRQNPAEGAAMRVLARGNQTPARRFGFCT